MAKLLNVGPPSFQATKKMVLSSGEARSWANSKITCFYYRKIWTAEGIGHKNVEMPVEWLKVVQEAPLKVHVKWMTNSVCSGVKAFPIRFPY